MVLIQKDGVQTHPTGAGRPLGCGLVLAQRGQLLPVLAAVSGAKERRVLDAGVDNVGIRQRRFEMPDALELPWARSAVVPEVLPRRALVGELVPDRIPGLATVVGALNDLPEPTRVLCGIDPVRVNRRALDVIDIPASEVRAADVPLRALRVRGHDERPFMRTNQYPDSAHASLLPESSLRAIREYGTSQLMPGSLLPRSGRQRGRRRPQAGEPSPRR